MPRVLMLAHWFPPCRQWPTAGRRAEGFARHLPEFGWEAVVVAPDLGAYGLCDCGADHGASVDGLDVRRIPLRPARIASLAPARGNQSDSPDAAGTVRLSVAATLRSMFESRGRWLTAATRAVAEAIASEPVDAIWTTSNPHSSAVVGARLQRQTRLPWVADLRDPIDDIILAPGAHPGPQVLVRAGFVKPALRRASAVVAATRDSAAADATSLGRPVTWAYSGVRDEWIEQARAARSAADQDAGETAPRATLIGAIYEATMDIRPVVEGLALLSTEGSRVHLDYLGPDGDRLVERATSGGFDAIVDHGLQSPESVRGSLATSDVNLLLEHTGGSTRIPGKVFELLAAARPIVAIPGSSGELQAILRESALGVSAATASDVAGSIRQALKTPAHDIDAAQLTPWLTSTATSRLAAVLDAALRGTPTS